MERKGIIAAGNMLVDHVHQIGQWPERGWLVEIVHSERATGGAPLNVLLTLAKMHAGLPLQAVGLIGEDNDGDYITAMLDQYHINRQLVQRTSSAPTSMTQVMTDAEGQRTFFHSPGANRLLDLPAFEPLDAPLKISISAICCCSKASIAPMKCTAPAARDCWRRCASEAMRCPSIWCRARATRATGRWSCRR